MIIDKLCQARCLLLMESPAYGHVAMRMKWIPSHLVNTMGVRVVRGGEIECVYRPDFVDSLSLLETYAVIQHECEHVVRMHCVRRSGLDPDVWNVAADMTVNGRRSQPQIGYRVDRGSRPVIPCEDKIIWIPEYWDPSETAEGFYRRLMNHDQPWVARGDLLDDHGLWDDTDLSKAELAEVVRAMLTEISRLGGSIPGEWQRLVHETPPAQVPWHVLLRRYLAQTIGDRRWSYLRRNRRRDQFGIPGVLRRRFRRLSVIIDVSGSVSDTTLEQFFGEIDKATENAQLDVLLWDHAFQGFFHNYRARDWRHIPLTGRGGTDMAAPVDWLVDNKKVGNCVVILTDGYCNWPTRRSFPLVAVITTPSLRGPRWGRTVYIRDDRQD